MRSGDLDAAEAVVTSGRALAAKVQDPLDMGRFEMGLGRVARARGENRAAALHYESARALMEKAKSRLGIALCVNSRADIARFEGDLGLAERGYREARALYDSLGSVDRFIPRLNLGLVLLARSEYEDARGVLHEVLAMLSGESRPGFVGLVHLALVPCGAGLEDWESFDRHLDEALYLLESAAMHDPDIAWPAELAGDKAAAAGFPQRAARAWEVARAQWSALGRSDDLSRVTRALDG
jgi:tetratricopeptide (TPR) repeat protein